MPKKYFITRHRGAVRWAADGGMRARKVEMEHFDPAVVERGDVVAGTLPVHLAAAVNARGGHYWHLAMEVPPAWRGQELSAEQMRAFGARLEEYRIASMGVRVSSGPELGPAEPAGPATHLCIASDQTLANLLPLRLLPWRRVIVYASKAMQAKADRLRRLIEALPRPDGAPADCAVVHLPAALDWTGLHAFAAGQADSLADAGPLDLNITGGNKLMALAFAEAFRSRARLLYCATDRGSLDVVDAQSEASIALPDDLLDLDTYLGDQGYRIVRRVALDDADALAALRRREQLTVSLVLACAGLAAARGPNDKIEFTLSTEPASSARGARRSGYECRNLLGLLHQLGAEARSSRLNPLRPFRPLAVVRGVGQDKVWGSVFDALQRYGLVADLKYEGVGKARSASMRFLDEAAAAYVGGGYLEEYVMLALASLDLSPRHYARAVGIGPAERNVPGSRDELNELDAAAVWRNRLLVFECKAGLQLCGADGQNTINKLDQIKDNVGGTWGQAWLITPRMLGERASDARERAAINRIRLLEGHEDMVGLAGHIARALGVDAPTRWPPASLVLKGFPAKAQAPARSRAKPGARAAARGRG